MLTKDLQRLLRGDFETLRKFHWKTADIHKIELTLAALDHAPSKSWEHITNQRTMGRGRRQRKLMLKLRMNGPILPYVRSGTASHVPHAADLT